jgi:hypothetical protein
VVRRISQAHDGRGIFLSLGQVAFRCKMKFSKQRNWELRPNGIPFISRGKVDSSNKTDISLEMPPKISERHRMSLSVETTDTTTFFSTNRATHVRLLT